MFQRFFVFGADAHAIEASSGSENDRVMLIQKNVQAVFFGVRMESGDNREFLIGNPFDNQIDFLKQ
jgi:hypothetical protein